MSTIISKMSKTIQTKTELLVYCPYCWTYHTMKDFKFELNDKVFCTDTIPADYGKRPPLFSVIESTIGPKFIETRIEHKVWCADCGTHHRANELIHSNNNDPSRLWCPHAVGGADALLVLKAELSNI